MSLLEVKDLRTVFATEEGPVRAVDGVSFSMERGDTLGVVGESGSGKSVTALSIMRLIATPGTIAGGSVLFDGMDLTKASEEEMRRIRGNRIAMIFQDPMTSLNPVLTVGYQVMEAIELHQSVSRREARARTIELFERVRIPNAAQRIDEYPHQFSGGLRQRVMIAMALSCRPDLLIADEPTTALDVTIQAQILELVSELKDEIDSATILITHDLGVVAEVAQRVMVMYGGRTVEYGTTRQIYYESLHPYTLGLLASVPSLVGERSRLDPIRGVPPSLVNLPPGCSFSPRCDYAEAVCFTEAPPLTGFRGDHKAACHVTARDGALPPLLERIMERV